MHQSVYFRCVSPFLDFISAWSILSCAGDAFISAWSNRDPNTGSQEEKKDDEQQQQQRKQEEEKARLYRMRGKTQTKMIIRGRRGAGAGGGGAGAGGGGGGGAAAAAAAGERVDRKRALTCTGTSRPRR